MGGQHHDGLQLREQRQRDAAVREEGLRRRQVQQRVHAADRLGGRAARAMGRRPIRQPLHRERARRALEPRGVGRLGRPYARCVRRRQDALRRVGDHRRGLQDPDAERDARLRRSSRLRAGRRPQPRVVLPHRQARSREADRDDVPYGRPFRSPRRLREAEIQGRRRVLPGRQLEPGVEPAERQRRRLLGLGCVQGEGQGRAVRTLRRREPEQRLGADPEEHVLQPRRRA